VFLHLFSNNKTNSTKIIAIMVCHLVLKLYLLSFLDGRRAGVMPLFTELRYRILKYKIFCCGGRLGGGSLGGEGSWVVEGVGLFGELVGGGSRVDGRWVVGER